MKRKKGDNPLFQSPKGPKKIRSVIDAIDPELRVTCDRDTYFCHSKETVKEMKKGEPDEDALSTMLKVGVHDKPISNTQLTCMQKKT